MSLTSGQRRYLKGLAHHLDPVVLVGDAGVSDAVKTKIRVELEHHELIKVRVPGGPPRPKELAGGLADDVDAELVQTIGRMVVLYKRRDKDPEIRLPKA